MSDNKRWFKVWTDILIDDDFIMSDLKTRGIWVTLGALVAKQGEGGKITVKRQYLERILGITEGELEALESVGIGTLIGNDTITVTFHNWYKYQVDTTGYERVQEYRNRNGTKNKNKEEEEDKEKKKKKSKYGKYKNVLLTDEEYLWLDGKLGDKKEEWVETFSEGIKMKDYRYKSHYLAILKWSRNEKQGSGYNQKGLVR